ncbi:hypothetical protein [Streptomyces lasalocidi]|uniref:hypothetical protein n=1 Tax=Streptomyces lasalocidi TaxID=324833 RepID=UPI001F4FC1B4|nr:hypothetical protein [Streptomyces lasalocidi]
MAAAILPPLDLPSSHHSNGTIVSLVRVRNAMTVDRVAAAVAAHDPRENEAFPVGRPALPPGGKVPGMHPVTRSSARLALRELAAADVDAVLAIYGSPAATEHLSFEPRDREQVEQIVARSVAAATATPRTDNALAVIGQTTAELIGFGRLALDPHQQRGAPFSAAAQTRGVER